MKEGKLRVYGILFMMIFVFTFIFGALIHDLSSAINIITVSFLFAGSYWELSRWVILKAGKLRPGLKNTKNRILLILQFLLPCAILIPILEMEVLQIMKVIYFTSHNYWNYLFYFSLDIICLVVIVTLYESVYYIQNWKIQHAETERMKEMNINTQYQFLKDQIKPHFLFNSLNTLTHLISNNSEKAEQFVEEMSTVYRYLLSKKEKELSVLSDELDFLKAYIGMLKTRFDDCLIIDIKIDENKRNYLIPPFVLQLLVENAVKHNKLSGEFPLTVSIKNSANDCLVISNNIQKKHKVEPSEKTGLINLITRYKLLNKEEELIILNDDKTFTVILPLIKPKAN